VPVGEAFIPAYRPPGCADDARWVLDSPLHTPQALPAHRERLAPRRGACKSRRRAMRSSPVRRGREVE
jgi:hypothetical protein